jgi:CRISPR/Cas system-associated protein Cas7 (RAMP superfamily)
MQYPLQAYRPIAYFAVNVNSPVITNNNRRLYKNEELHGLYSSPSIVRVIKTRRMRWAGHVARMGKVRGAYNILVGTPERRRPLGRHRRRGEDNIKMDLREIGFWGVDWINLAQDRDRWRALVNTVMNLLVP